jgi:hypothetical protein
MIECLISSVPYRLVGVRGLWQADVWAPVLLVSIMHVSKPGFITSMFPCCSASGFLPEHTLQAKIIGIDSKMQRIPCLVFSSGTFRLKWQFLTPGTKHFSSSQRRDDDNAMVLHHSSQGLVFR